METRKIVLVGGPSDGKRIEAFAGAHTYKVFDPQKQLATMTRWEEDVVSNTISTLPFTVYTQQIIHVGNVTFYYASPEGLDPEKQIEMLFAGYRTGKSDAIDK